MTKNKKTKNNNKFKQQVNQDNSYSKNYLFYIYTAIIFVSAFLLYINTLKHDYCLDDDIYTKKNIYVQQGFSAIKQIFNQGSLVGFNGANDSNYRPIVLLNFMIETHIWGLNPHVNHFFNILFFAITCILLFILLNKMFKRVNIFFPFAMTLLFAFHPIHTEVVANIKSRDEILSLLFGIISFIFILKYNETPKIISYLISLFFFFLSLLSKENSLTFAAIIPLLLYFFTPTSIKRIVILTIPYLLLIGIYIIIRKNVLSSMTFEVELPVINNALMAAKDNLWNMYATNFVFLGKYFVMLFVPYPLSWDYTYNQIPIVSWSNYKSILSLLLYIGIAIYIIIRFKHKDVYVFSLLIFLITLFLSSNLVIKIGSTWAERFLYTPSLGYCIAIPLLLAKILKIDIYAREINKKILYFSILGILLFIYALILIPRNMDWKDNYTLFLSGIKTSPNSARTHGAIASEYRVKGENATDVAEKQKYFRMAINEYKIAAQIYDKDADNYYNQGVTYYQMGDLDSALIQYLKTLDLMPNYTKALNNAGVIYFSKKDFNTAIKLFKKVLQIDPNYADPYINLGAAYQNLNRYDTAIYYYNKGLQLNPSSQNAYRNMSVLYNSIGVDYFNKKEWNKALENFELAYKYDPTSSNATTNIGAVYQNLNNITKAIEFYKKGLQLNPENKIAHRNISKIYKELGDIEKANYHALKAN